MATETFGQSVLTAQLNAIQDVATELALVKTFLRADSYAQTQAKIVARKTLTVTTDPIWGTRVPDEGAPGDASAQNMRQNCIAVTLDPATDLENTEGTDLALVFMSGSEVLAVSDETTSRAVAEFDVITTYAFYIQANQPVQA
jgi:hypothetical protein